METVAIREAEKSRAVLSFIDRMLSSVDPDRARGKEVSPHQLGRTPRRSRGARLCHGSGGRAALHRSAARRA